MPVQGTVFSVRVKLRPATVARSVYVWLLFGSVALKVPLRSVLRVSTWWPPEERDRRLALLRMHAERHPLAGLVRGFRRPGELHARDLFGGAAWAVGASASSATNARPAILRMVGKLSSLAQARLTEMCSGLPSIVTGSAAVPS